MIGPPVERAISVGGRCQSKVTALGSAEVAISETSQLALAMRSVPLSRIVAAARV